MSTDIKNTRYKGEIFSLTLFPMNRHATRGGRARPNAPGRQTFHVQSSHRRQIRSIPSALGPEIAKKTLEGIHANSATEQTVISELQFIASYNLFKRDSKTILVPGRPPVWTPLPGATTLSPDGGQYYRDENAARFPDYQMEPAVESIFRMEASFDPSNVDIFACGSTLGHILRFVNGTPQPFSFVIHVIGKTAFFLRRNHTSKELIDNVHGYGHTFPESYTTWSRDVKGSASHQRIVQYSFGGLRLLVRFEADGYILDQADDLEEECSPFTSETATVDKCSEVSTEALVQNFPEDVLENKSPRVECAEGSLHLLGQGCRTPQSSVFDVKTRSSRKRRDEIMAEQLPRLWVRQIHKFVLAFHTNGRFNVPEVLDVTSDLRDWERKSESALSHMAALLRDIRATALAVKGGKLEVRGSDLPALHLHELSNVEMSRWNALPDRMRELWEQARSPSFEPPVSSEGQYH